MVVIYLLISVLLIIWLTAKLKVHPFIALLLVAIFYGIIAGMPLNNIITSVNKGFGNTLGGIGMIIILGVIIGAFLENSGGAYALAEKVLKFTGKKKIPFAMGIIGWFVSIPVFADSGFMLLAPLNKSLSKKAGITLSGTAIALGLGLIAAHTMVPPTPGPIAAAHYLNADLGLVILMGIPISLLALLMGLVFIKKYVSKTYIAPDPNVTEEDIKERLKTAPSAFKATIPIFVPIILIVIKSLLTSVYDYQSDNFETFPAIIKILFFLGEPFIALLIGCFLSLTLPKKLNKDMFSTSGWIGKALVGAASIILITGAGGIFGQVLRDSGIATTLGEALSGINLSIWLPFLLAAAIKTAQGSSTVALITAASILAPMMATLGFDTELQKAMVVVAIGAGSAVVVHANDSFFWVVTQLSGMDVKLGYRFLTLGSFVLGASAAILLFILYLILS
ncbi:GntP family permease [Flaviramulus sp. BrNp1-15]|uniref:GntP family permease n=1 Tax=Flaviramulus sp. BrNp1-15 TaxID=2916754 RepID=UPI001EE89D1A|nr:GntP family permease [Flaviramulus sp. BrNp1-15]ULC60714.1 GntP family permease [Flaviramulus sp. BrNp1-15]